MNFKLKAPFEPMGDQPTAIDDLVEGLSSGERNQVLLGVTGSGKTFTVANVIERTQRPSLILCHNKNSGRTALWRNERIFSRECGRILCELLRLLST